MSLTCLEKLEIKLQSVKNWTNSQFEMLNDSKK